MFKFIEESENTGITNVETRKDWLIQMYGSVERGLDERHLLPKQFINDNRQAASIQSHKMASWLPTVSWIEIRWIDNNGRRMFKKTNSTKFGIQTDEALEFLKPLGFRVS